MHSIVCACPRFSIAFILCLRKVEGQDQAESNIFRQNSGNATQRSESSDGLRDGLRIHHLSGRLFGSVKTHASRLKLLAKCCLRASSKALAKCSCGVGRLGERERPGIPRRRHHRPRRARGHKVSLPQVERALASVPGCESCCAVALPDAALGSLIVVVVEAAETPSKHVMQQELRRLLAPQFVPHRYYRVGELPRTAGGKIRRIAVAELVEHGGAERL